MRNRLLAALDPSDLALIRPHLTLRALEVRTVLIEPGEPIRHVYFVEAGIASFISPGEDAIEIGLVGRDGMVGQPVLLGVESSPLKVTIQITGEGYEMPTGTLLEAVEASPTLRAMLLRYVHVFQVQTASTAYANAQYSVDERLARWLLTIHDRVDGDEIALTHEFLAVMLGVRRPGVTVATHVLEGEGAIRARRGRIIIRDRAKLAAKAGKSFGLAEAEYERLIGPLRGDPPETAG